MKKFLIGLVAAMCCFALAAPAMAEVKISGMITLDTYYFNQDAENLAGGVPAGTSSTREDRSRTRINLPQALNRFDVQWTSEDKKVHGRIQLRYGSPSAWGDGTAAQAAAGNQGAPAQMFDPEFAYIDYHWTPNFYTRFGRMEQTFSIMAPSQGLGQNDGHIVLASWGNVHGGTARDGVKGYLKFSDMVRLEVELLDPSNNTAEAVAAFPAAAGDVVLENSVIPRIDAALNVKVANFVIEPSVTYLKQEYEGLAAGADDSVDIWGAAIGVAAGFGPFKASGEVTYGQNLGNANYVGGGGPVLGLAINNGTNEIEDTKVLAAWIDLGFNFGPAELHGIVGYEKFDNDGTIVVNDDNKRERMAYGLNLPIKMTKNFTIKPEVFYYDQDDSAEVAGADRDFGSEYIAGVQFMLVF